MGKYRFGFNGQEKTDEIEGNANYIDFTYRGYSTRLGKFVSIDPLFQNYPFYSTYQFASNNPILAVDLEGLESSNIKNNTETTSTSQAQSGHSTEKNKAGEPITAVTPQGANMIDTYTGSDIGIGPWTNPKNAQGEDDFSRDADNESDQNSKIHDGTPNNTSNASLKADAIFIINQLAVAAKSAENLIVNPIANINPVSKMNSNQDKFEDNSISGTTGIKAAITPVVIGGIAIGKVALRVATAAAVAARSVETSISDSYREAEIYIENIGYETARGLSSINNWGKK